MRKRTNLPNCAFCEERVACATQQQHTQRHVAELTDIYRQIGEDQGFDIQFGVNCHSICCHHHTIQLRPLSQHVDVGEFLHSFRNPIRAIFQQPLIRSTRVRAQFIVYASFENRREMDGRENNYQGSFLSRMLTVTAEDIDEQISEVVSRIEPKLEKFCHEKSGWILKSLDALSIKMNCGVNHSGGIPVNIPPHLKKCRYVKVLRGGEASDHCFQTAVRYCLAQKAGINMREFQDVSKVEIVLREKFCLDCRDMPFPFESKYFHTFEKRNNIALRVYLHDGYRVRGTLYAKPAAPQSRKVYLLYLANEQQGEKFPGHFLPITNMRALVNDIEKTSNKHLNFFCDFCLSGFRGQKQWDLHHEFCSKIEKPQRTVIPKNLTHHEFKDHQKSTRPINVVYADMESMIKPLSDGTKQHTPIAVGCQTVWHESLDEDSHEQQTFIGESCVPQFLSHLEQLVHTNVRLLEETHKKITVNEDDIEQHNAAIQCAFCSVRFNANESDAAKCADHDHLTGAYLQALCAKCNRVRRQSRYKLTVLFHNFKGYDSNFLVRNGLLKRTDWKISPLYQTGCNVIALNVDIPLSGKDHRQKMNQNEDEELESALTNEPKRNSRNSYRIVFIDSLQFLKGSLDSLSKNLESTPFTESMLQRYYDLQDSMKKYTKGIFPYNFLDSLEKLKEKCLPPIEAFYNDLTGKPCSSENYEIAKETWEAVRCSSFEDYMIYYLKLDVALLTDCFESFRKTAFKAAGLDPVHYFGIPGFTFSFAFKYTGMKLQAIPSIDMYLLFEQGIRGGMTFINKHHLEANFDQDTGLYHHIFDCDKNNLYGQSMSIKLPKDGFRKMTPEEIKMFTTEWFVKSFDSLGNKGYLLRCDLGYPPKIQDETMDLPLAPEASVINWDDLSPYSQAEWRRQRGTEPFISCQKLLLTHRDKKNYVVHSTTLQYYLKKGMQLKTVHEAIEFNQEAYLKPYVDYHTDKRSKAETDEAKNFHKLNVNSLFGKTIENPRKYKKSYLVRKPHFLFRYASSPLCESIIPLDENTCIANLRKPEVELSKPLFVGQAILDYSKMVMYQMLDRWKANPLIDHVEAAGGDTDSLFLYVISKHSRNEILQSFEREFDSSNYPRNHPLYSTANRAKLGCFKDETKGEAILSLYMQAPKTYSILTENDLRIARAKGIQQHKRDSFTHEEYRQIQQDQQGRTVSQTFIRAKEHRVYTIMQKKRALTCWDTKRFWLDDNTSVPYGCYRIQHHLSRINAVNSGSPLKKRRKIEEL